MEVKNIMKKDIITINDNMNIADAAKKLIDNNITGAPVVNKNNKLVGVISEKDIFKTIYPNYKEYYSLLGFKEEKIDIKKRLKEIKNKKVKEIMSKRVVSVDQDDSAMKVGAIMMIKKINRVLVVKNGKLVGLVCRKEVYPHSLNLALKIFDMKK